MKIDSIRDAVTRRLPGLRDELAAVVRIPSVSAQNTGIEECVAEVTRVLERRDLKVTIHNGYGNPVITAEGGRADGPTVLFYEHYDVQPPEPLEEWTVEPFDLTDKDGKWYGRGVADTKGHILCRLGAIDALREVYGEDPCRYVFLIEGEEETGSAHLGRFIEENAAILKSDACLWEFGGASLDGSAQIGLGLKGILTVEITVSGPKHDLHSMNGAVVDNPAWRLAAALSTLRDLDGRVLIDGFYDGIPELTALEEKILGAYPDYYDELVQATGVKRFFEDARGYELAKKIQTEPCLNVNGFHSGYGGTGAKTVLPSKAVAKLDFRLVPGQNPERIFGLLREHLASRGFSDFELKTHGMEEAGRADPADPFVQTVIATAAEVYGKPPMVALSSGGTGPAHPFVDILKVPFAAIGVTYPESRIHAPDEHIRVSDFENGVVHTAAVLKGFAE